MRELVLFVLQFYDQPAPVLRLHSWLCVAYSDKLQMQSYDQLYEFS